MRHDKMARHESKAQPGENQPIGLTDVGAKDVIEILVDLDDICSPGEIVPHEVGGYLDNLAIGPKLVGVDDSVA